MKSFVVYHSVFYDDGLALVIHLRVWNERLEAWKRALESKGLRVNAKETKMMVFSVKAGMLVEEESWRLETKEDWFQDG